MVMSRKRRTERAKGPDMSTWTPAMVAAHKNEEKLETPVAEMKLSVRTVNTLESAGIIVARDLVRRDYNCIVSITNLGGKSIEEMKKAVVALGLPAPDWNPPPPVPRTLRFKPIVELW